MILTKEIIVSKVRKRGKPFEDVPMPELGDEVEIRIMSPSLGGMDDLQRILLKNGRPQEGYKANLLIATCVDSEGQPLFDEDDFQMLNDEFDSQAFMKLVPVAERLCGFSQQNINKIVKNLNRDQSNGSD